MKWSHKCSFFFSHRLAPNGQVTCGSNRVILALNPYLHRKQRICHAIGGLGFFIRLTAQRYEWNKGVSSWSRINNGYNTKHNNGNTSTETTIAATLPMRQQNLSGKRNKCKREIRMWSSRSFCLLFKASHSHSTASPLFVSLQATYQLCSIFPRQQ